MKKNGFTLMELMIVIVILGIIIAFAIPNYQKTISSSHERDMAMQLTSLHAANYVYRGEADTFLSPNPNPLTNITDINTQLGINLTSSDNTNFTYQFLTATSFTATATWNNFSLTINQNPIVTTGLTQNPCCSTAGLCPSIPNC